MDGTQLSEYPQRLSPLFRSHAFGRTLLKNRVVMAPMTRFHSPNGIPGKDVAEYYARRAAGGVGLIITEGAYIDHAAANGFDDVPAFYGESLPGWKAVVDLCHAHGAKIVPQLWHVGGQRRAGIQPDPGVIGCSPMDVVEDGKLVARALTEWEIQEIVASYGRAAKAATKLGFDGVEIHGAHGYLIDQFLWDQSNQRTDRYGGSIENRVRFASEVVKEVKANLAVGLPLILRISQWKTSDYAARIANDPGELAQILKPLVEAGVDMFHVSTRRFDAPAFEGGSKTLAHWVRDIAQKPVIAVGGVGLVAPHVLKSEGGHDNAWSEVADVEPAAHAIGEGACDLIAIGRALLADAELVNKLRDGRMSEIKGLRPDDLNRLT